MAEQAKRVFIAIGSNLGDREKNIIDAINLLIANGVDVKNISSIIETKPYGNVKQPDFLNCVVDAYTALPPRMLLETLKAIEKQLGRTRTIHWGPRTIDLDIIFYDELVIDTSDLKIPHPDMQNRLFVLEPLNQLAPNFVHPVLNKTVRELLVELRSKK
ncbi:MAG: 2-amino-4-hydroxy-6-hydroxymethyldihydropteridine diphosphokinase [Candidatus Atribacteria bacterium]|nr:2-amino-4-hydroxy-6-hydroxymethyldihydropteridine diphosphokinase [Candidatus Atribacteria bacterium]